MTARAVPPPAYTVLVSNAGAARRFRWLVKGPRSEFGGECKTLTEAREVAQAALRGMLKLDRMRKAWGPDSPRVRNRRVFRDR